MEPDKPLLELISDKEVQLKEKYDNTCKIAEKIRADARMQAGHILKTAEQEGKMKGEELLKREMTILQDELRQIREEGEETVNSIRMIGEKNLSATVKTIIQAVTG